MMKLGRVILEICVRTDRQTRSSQYRATLPNTNGTWRRVVDRAAWASHVVAGCRTAATAAAAAAAADGCADVASCVLPSVGHDCWRRAVQSGVSYQVRDAMYRTIHVCRRNKMQSNVEYCVFIDVVLTGACVLRCQSVCSFLFSETTLWADDINKWAIVSCTIR